MVGINSKFNRNILEQSNWKRYFCFLLLIILLSSTIIQPATNSAFATVDTWDRQSTPVSVNLSGISFVDANNGWAAGANGIILVTTNGGTDWTEQSTPVSVNLSGISFVDANNGWAAGANGIILVTTNGGTDWTEQSTPVFTTLRSISFVDANNGWAAGANGIILVTTNGGADWTEQNTPVSTTLRYISFVDANNGWVVGINGIILVGSDGTRPTVSITSSESSPTNSNSIPITVTFDEAVTGFSVNDITVSGGIKSGFTGSGSSYSINIDPSGDGTITVDISENVADDGAGNGNDAANTFSITSDRTRPTVSITSSESSPTNSNSIPITVTFDEAVTGFSVNDITVSGGIKSGFTGSGSSYSINIDPSGDGTITVDISENVADAVSAPNNLNEAADTFSITSDRTAPTADEVRIIFRESSPTSSNPILFTIPTNPGFTGPFLTDLVVTGGVLTPPISLVDPIFSVIPDGNGTVTITIPIEGVIDAAGNPSMVEISNNIEYNTNAPTPIPIITTSSAFLNVNSITIDGTTRVGVEITLIRNEGTFTNKTTSSNMIGEWSFTNVALTDGVNTFTVVLTEAGEIISPPSLPLVITTPLEFSGVIRNAGPNTVKIDADIADAVTITHVRVDDSSPNQLSADYTIFQYDIAKQAALVVDISPPITESQSSSTSEGRQIQFVGGAIDIELYRQGSDSPDTDIFMCPCDITLTYDDSSLGIPENELSIFHFDESARAWKKLDSTVNEVTNMIDATTDFFSLFAIGMITSDDTQRRGGGSSSGDRTPPSISTGFGPNEFPLAYDEVHYRSDQLDTVHTAMIKTGVNLPGQERNWYTLDTVHTAMIKTGEEFKMTLSVYENSGREKIPHVDLYVNHFGSRILNDFTETFVTYYKQSGIEITDPNNLIATADIISSISGNKDVFDFVLVFKDEIPKSDVLIRLWDDKRNSLNLYLPDALIVKISEQSDDAIPIEPAPELSEPAPELSEPAPELSEPAPELSEHNERQTKYQILKPESPAPKVEIPWVFASEELSVLKKWAGYTTETASGLDVLSKFGIKGEKIPSHVKELVKLILNDELDKEEFLNTLQLLKREGMLSNSAERQSSVNEEDKLKVTPKRQYIGEKIRFDENILYAKANLDDLEDKIRTLRSLANNAQIQNNLVMSNLEFETLADIKSLIYQRDSEWQRNPKTVTPFMNALMNNESALIAKAIIEHDKESLVPLNSIVITNAYGANTAITEKTSDYKQSDEKWWSQTKESGINIMSGSSNEESTGLYTVEISIRIDDIEGNFIGIIKAVVNFDKVYLSD